MTENAENNKIQIGEDQLNLLERLCNAAAVSGDEGEVRKIVLEEIQPHADEVEIDALGNVLAKRIGKGDNKLGVMIAAHMDEVGFMITDKGNKGFYRFDNVGGLDVRQLIGKPVIVGSEHIPGVIGIKPIHLTKHEETQHSPQLESLRIDVGAENSSKVKLGDRATFATKFTRIGESIRTKALDDRFGVATLIELLKQPPENIDLLAAFTVQEEVGLRGAQVAAYSLNPDVAFVLDCTPAYDLPAWEENDSYMIGGKMKENTQFNTLLGKGPAIYIADRATLSDPRLVRFLEDTAVKHHIPYQFRQPGRGGTDAGAIHKRRAGIPTISVSVPARYIHTPAAIARISDWENTLKLMYTALRQITPELLNQER